MSSPRINLRSIRFTASFTDPGAGAGGGDAATITSQNYLYYILPYPTNVLIYTNNTKGFTTKTFQPNTLIPQTDILDIDTQSVTYNKEIIQNYIDNGIFSTVTIYTTTAAAAQTQASGITVDISNPLVNTEIPNFIPPNLTINYIDLLERAPFYRNNIITWIQSNQFADSLPTHYLHTKSLTGIPPTTVIPLNSITEVSFNPVIDSFGAPIIVNTDMSVGGVIGITPLVYNSNTLTFDLPAPVVTYTFNTYQQPRTLLIDSNDFLYVVLEQSVSRLDAGGVATLLFDVTTYNNLAYINSATYDPLTNSFSIYLDINELLNVSIDGVLLSVVTSMTMGSAQFTLIPTNTIVERISDILVPSLTYMHIIQNGNHTDILNNITYQDGYAAGATVYLPILVIHYDIPTTATTATIYFTSEDDRVY